MKKVLCATAALAAVLLMAAPAMAQRAPGAVGPAVETVHVWGQLEESLADELAKYGSRVDVVTGEEIKKGGFDDASQVLQMKVPGLYVAPKNGAFDYVNVSLLGGRRQDVIWLLDGVRISNRLYTTTTPLDTIPSHMIEKIEVLKGGQSLFYGTSATSGAINVVTKAFTKDHQGEFSLGADSNEGRHVNAYDSGSFGNSSYAVFGSHDEADGIQPYRDKDYQPSATDRDRGYDVTTLGAKYGYEFSDALKVSANYIHTDAKLDFAAPSQVAEEFNKRIEDILSAKIDWVPNDKFSFYAKGYYHWWTAHFTQLDNNEPPNGALVVQDNNEFWGFKDYGINLLGQYNVTSALAVLGGVDYQNYNGRDQVFRIEKKTEYVIAPFAQVRYTAPVLAGLNLAAGARTNITKDDQTTTVWNVSGRLDINSYLYARAMAGTSFRLPDAYELFVNDPCCEQGNPKLVGEKSENYEAALGGHLDWFSWELTGFHRRIKDLIQIIEIPEDRPLSGGQLGHLDSESCSIVSAVGCYDTFDNNGTPVETNGGEFYAAATFGDGFTASGDWTHTESKVKGSGTGQLNDIPKDTVKVQLDWAPAKLPVGVGASVIYVGDTVTGVNPAPTDRNYGGYTVLDLTGRWYVDAKRKQRIGIRVENLFDEEYYSSYTRGRIDGTTTRYPVGNLGTGRAFHIDYTVGF